ncbi:MAG: hypothetical protein JNM84_08280 [Planctomycetes bacterium]|nr:hypothetical protein [Planctomycetota bacterium]
MINPPVYSPSFDLTGFNAVQFQALVMTNTIVATTSLTCSLQGSSDGENWTAIASSSVTFASAGVGISTVRVTGLSFRYLRIVYAAGSPAGAGGVAIVETLIVPSNA